jgi:hypothetical protein
LAVPRIHGNARVLADNGGPRPHMPTVHEPCANIWIGRSETLGHVRGIALKQERGAIYRVSVSSGENKLAPRVSIPRADEVFVAELRATLKIVRYELVKQQVVHPLSLNR